MARPAAGPERAGGSGRASGCESAGGRCGERWPRPHQPCRDAPRQPAPPPSAGGGVCVCVLFFYSLFHSFQKRLVLETSASCPAQPPGTLPAPRPAAGSPGTAGAGGTPRRLPVGSTGHGFSGMCWHSLAGRRDMPTRAGVCRYRVGWGVSVRPRGRAVPVPRAMGRVRPCPRPTRPLPGFGPRPAGTGRSELPETTSPTLIPEASRRD